MSELKVLNLAGETLLSLALDCESTVLQLKSSIEIACGHTIEMQQLVYAGCPLEDDLATLRELGMQGGAEVSLILKPWDADFRIGRLKEGQDLAIDDVKLICSMAREAFLKQPSLLELRGPVVMAGHLIGCAKQLMHILDTFGEPPRQYLFLGNYVGRGRRQIHTLLLLLLYRQKYPERVHLLRGSSECGAMSRKNGFYDECKRKLNVKMWKSFVDLFNCMPFGAILEDRILCLPSGLSPELRDVDQLRQIARPCDVSESGLLSDLLWSSFKPSIKGWSLDGDIREFGPDVLDDFLALNSLEMMCCSCKVLRDTGHEAFGRWISVSSTSNYLGESWQASRQLYLSVE